MFSRAIKRSILDTRISVVPLPPTFLLPSRARYFNSTQQHIESPLDSIKPSTSTSPKLPVSHETVATTPYTPRPTVQGRSAPQPPPPISEPLELSPSVKELLPLLAVQPSHYISAHIHGKPYLVATGDIVRLPFRMPGVVPGDVLRLNRASALGSRDYTLKGAPYVDERLFECRARVMGTESEPLRIKEKKKRRNRKIKHAKSKHRYTLLRIAELKINNVEDLES